MGNAADRMASMGLTGEGLDGLAEDWYDWQRLRLTGGRVEVGIAADRMAKASVTEVGLLEHMRESCNRTNV